MSDKHFARNNGRFKILTDSGFSDFVGVTKTASNHDTLELMIENTSITVTPDHEIYISPNEYVKSSTLKVGDSVYTQDGNKIITNISKTISKSVYDILHVFNGNRFFITDGKDKLLILIRNCLYIDEIAFIPNVEAFYESVFPTISSSDKTKVIITSTPLGMNYFYKMWVEAEDGRSAYVPYDVKWYENPERDQKWYDTMCESMSSTAIEQEMNCVSGDTILDIDGNKVEIEKLYNKFNKSTDNVIAYVNDINITIK